VPWPEATWQSAHISTVNSPSTLLNGPLVEPQNEQRSPSCSSGQGAAGVWPPAGNVAAADPAVGVGPELPLEETVSYDLAQVLATKAT
jgi:hypothetical protein